MSSSQTGDSKLFARGKVTELRSELNSGKKDKNFSAKKVALKKIVANMTMANNDMVALFPDIINCMHIQSLEIKKMCFLYLVHYARMRPEIAIKAIPVLEQDVRDANPLIRSLALRTISYVHVKEFIDRSLPIVKQLMNDSDPYVRKTAAFSVAKLHDNNKAIVEKTDLVTRLNNLLLDDNSTVVASALAALHDIWERNEGIKLTIDYKHASKMVAILPECSEWGQTYILEALISYVPQNHTEAALLAERLTPRLSHSNAAVVLTCIRVILYLVNYIADPKQVSTLCRKLSPPLVTLLSKGPEVQYLALRNALLILQRRPEVLRNDIRIFFCNYNDPIYVKVTKLELIFMLANKDNISEVLAELREYATEIDVHFARKAVRAIGKLAIKIEPAARQCINVLLELVSTKVTYIVQEATVVIRNIFRKYPNQYESIISTLCENLDSLDEPEAKAAMIWVIGQYADRIENSDVLLEDFLFTFSEEPVEVQLALVTATVKLFILRPTKGQSLVPKVLKWATEETDNPDLRDRAYMYWRLLSTDMNATKDIVMGPKPVISAESEKLDLITLEELCLCIGTLATVYLKPVQAVFRAARARRLQDSPALQKQPYQLTPQLQQQNQWHTQQQQQPQQQRPIVSNLIPPSQQGPGNNQLQSPNQQGTTPSSATTVSHLILPQGSSAAGLSGSPGVTPTTATTPNQALVDAEAYFASLGPSQMAAMRIEQPESFGGETFGQNTGYLVTAHAPPQGVLLHQNSSTDMAGTNQASRDLLGL